jgi:hypothetical protein
MGRPIVRLEIATASNDPTTPDHVRAETVRQPSLGTCFSGVGGAEKSIGATVHSLHAQEVTLVVSLQAYGKVAIQKVVHLFPDVE